MSATSFTFWLSSSAASASRSIAEECSASHASSGTMLAVGGFSSVRVSCARSSRCTMRSG